VEAVRQESGDEVEGVRGSRKKWKCRDRVSGRGKSTGDKIAGATGGFADFGWLGGFEKTKSSYR
jgi:hypothetical protein